MKSLILLFAATFIFSGCTHTIGRPPIKLKLPPTPILPSTEVSYKYYVIDINSDIPDAFFETFEEASVYQKEFVENHEYVIVKLEKGYKVYNMVENQNDTQTIQTSK
jgi:predicted transglutaminase-like protease